MKCPNCKVWGHDEKLCRKDLGEATNQTNGGNDAGILQEADGSIHKEIHHEFAVDSITRSEVLMEANREPEHEIVTIGNIEIQNGSQCGVVTTKECSQANQTSCSGKHGSVIL